MNQPEPRHAANPTKGTGASRRWPAKLALTVVLLLAGFAVGTVNGDPHTDRSAGVSTEPEPVEVQVLPTECLRALDTAEELIGAGGALARIAADNASTYQDALDAFLTQDTGGLEQQTERLAANNDSMTDLAGQAGRLAPAFTDRAEQCRAVGG